MGSKTTSLLQLDTEEKYRETLDYYSHKKLWEISGNMWEQRNGKLQNPASPATLREHARIDAAITHEYQDPNTLAQRDRQWFR
jgi:hypothetical protein